MTDSEFKDIHFLFEMGFIVIFYILTQRKETSNEQVVSLKNILETRKLCIFDHIVKELNEKDFRKLLRIWISNFYKLLRLIEKDFSRSHSMRQLSNRRTVLRKGWFANALSWMTLALYSDIPLVFFIASRTVNHKTKNCFLYYLSTSYYRI